MRVLHVATELEHGGAERVVVQLVEGQVRRGLEVGVAAGTGALDAEIAGLDVRRTVLTKPRGRALGPVAGATVGVAAAVRADRPDVLHAHNVRATALALVGGRLGLAGRAPAVLTTFHGVTPEEYPAAARVLRRSGHTACVSGELRDGMLAQGVPADRLTVVENAVAPATPLSVERRRALDEELGLDGPVVAVVGRLVAQKAHDRFLAAAAAIAAHRSDVTFLVVGDGVLREDLERRARELGLTGCVRFTGARSDARDIIARADLLAFSSIWEGLSIAALEALAAGTPVVTTAAEGMGVLADEGAAVTVPGGDDDALATAISDLLADDARRERMGEAGRRLVAERFAVPVMLDAYERLYERLLDA